MQPERDQPAHGEEKVFSLVGCLDGNSRGFQFSDKEGNLYQFVGATSGLTKYVGDVVQAEGTINKLAKPLPSFHLTSTRLVSKVPAPRLSAAFRNAATWRAEENQTYGLKFSHPASFTAGANSDAELAPNFPIQDGTVALGSFEIPREVYAGTNFVGGYFRLSVNPEITNRASCEQFGRSDPKYVTSSTMDGVRYAVFTEGSAATGTGYTGRYFHTFQNGLCYELGFDVGEMNTRNLDMWCTVPSLSEEDEWNVMRPLLRRASFVPPEPSFVRKHMNGAPEVVSFTATPTINSITKRQETTFSWSTQNVDYVELSYDCPAADVSVVILDGGAAFDCGNRLDKTIPLKRSTNGSVTVDFANFHGDEPVPVRITMTPFGGAVPYSDLSRSLTVSVSSWNPLPEGAHTGTQNMTLSYFSGADKTHTSGDRR